MIGLLRDRMGLNGDDEGIDLSKAFFAAPLVAGEALEFGSQYYAAKGEKAPAWITAGANILSPQEQIRKVAGQVKSAGTWVLGAVVVLGILWIATRR